MTQGDWTWHRRTRNRRRAAAQGQDFAWEDVLGDYRGGFKGRYLRFPQIDRWRAAPFDMPSGPDRAALKQRILELIEQLRGAVDEGSGAVLDRQINSWVASWLAGVETDYVNHCALIHRLRGQGEQWARETAIELEQAKEQLHNLTGDYEILLARLRASGAAAPATRPGLTDDDQDDGRDDASQGLYHGPDQDPAKAPGHSKADEPDRPGLEFHMGFVPGQSGNKS